MNHSIVSHRRLYGLLHEKGLFDHRRDMVYSFSGGRTGNSADLSEGEIQEMIRHLQGDQPRNNPNSKFNRGADRMRKRILSICYTIGWTMFSEEKKKMIVDMDRLDGWMKKYSYLHKGLNEYTPAELPRLVSQFEKMESTVL